MKKKQIGSGIHVLSRKLHRALTGGLALTLCLGLISGCGASRNESASDYSMNAGAAVKSYQTSEAYMADADYAADELWTEGEAYESYDAGKGTATEPNLDKTSASKRKLIRNASMNVETQEYETLMANLEARIKELGGYIQNMESYNGNSYYSSKPRRNANLVVRIPQAKLDEFIGSVSDLANVVNRTESVNDVTLQYVDMQSHKESLQVEQARLLELLERAESLEDIITLENRLTNVRYQIESMESSLRTFDDQVDYSTVNLRIEEVVVYTPVTVEEKTVWQRMTEGFLESLESVGDGFVEFGVWFVVNIPYLVIWAVVITVIVLIIKKLRKGKKVKKAKKDKTESSAETTEEKNEEHG